MHNLLKKKKTLGKNWRLKTRVSKAASLALLYDAPYLVQNQNKLIESALLIDNGLVFIDTREFEPMAFTL